MAPFEALMLRASRTSASTNTPPHPAAMTEVATSTNHWTDRHYHVDQVLDRHGPRTDESFPTGEDVSPSLSSGPPPSSTRF